MPAVNSPQRVSWVNVLREAVPQVACEPGVTPEQREQTALACAGRSLEGMGAWVPPRPPHPRALHQGGKRPASQPAGCSRCGRQEGNLGRSFSAAWSAQERASLGPDSGLGGAPLTRLPSTASLEVAHQHHRVLLHVEDHRQIRAAGEGQPARVGSPLCRPSCWPLTLCSVF